MVLKYSMLHTTVKACICRTTHQHSTSLRDAQDQRNLEHNGHEPMYALYQRRPSSTFTNEAVLDATQKSPLEHRPPYSCSRRHTTQQHQGPVPLHRDRNIKRSSIRVGFFIIPPSASLRP
jgi:hypothetical protein